MNAAPHRREPRHILFILGGFTVEQLETKKSFWRREYYGAPVWMLAILGIGAAALCGVDIKAAVTLYVLPIMGGGNGSGADPLSEMWEQITGQSKDAFYSQAIAI